MESRKRSIVKAITWRIIATLLALAVIYFYTRTLGESLEITIVVSVANMAAYYVHERAWNKSNWGRN